MSRDQDVERHNGGEKQSPIDGIINYIYIENFPTLATPSYTDLEQQASTQEGTEPRWI
jgi:hypothetical protein